jgi:hypothetical protein
VALVAGHQAMGDFPVIKEMMLLRPAERQRALKMLDLRGYRFRWNVGVSRIAESVARVLDVPCPKSIEDQQRMIRRFIDAPPAHKQKPMVPLSISRQMQDVLDRAANPYRRFAGDGRG